MKTLGKYLIRLLIFEIAFSMILSALEAADEHMRKRERTKTTVDNEGNVHLGKDDYEVI